MSVATARRQQAPSLHASKRGRPPSVVHRQQSPETLGNWQKNDDHPTPSISVLQPSASFAISNKTPSAAKWCGNRQSGRSFILLTKEATAFLRSPCSR